MTEAVSRPVPSIVDFKSTQPEVTTAAPATDRLLKGSPQTTTRNYFSDSGGKFFAGVWESTSGRWRVSYTENEFCHVTRGRVRIEDHAGHSWMFGPGDSFVIPTGFAGVWEVLEPMSKLYVIYEATS